ncbi:MAG: hypothetical protein HQM16_05630 [Deltaproteobacteria bacterium]|nr:hypothetical protein [Deltaproteobacteria bacterium]
MNQNAGHAIRVGEFSKEATDTAVLKTTAAHPLTLYPLAIGVLGGLGVILFKAPVEAITAAVAGLGLGSLMWFINYFVRKKTFASRYIQRLQKKIEEQRVGLLNGLKKELENFKTQKGLEEFAGQAEAQFDMIHARFESIQKVLADKIQPGELTFNRYMGTAEQVYLSVLDNLQSIATLIKSSGNIDEDYIKGRFDCLKKLNTLAKADEEELETLERRLELRKKQLDEINTLLTSNEKAMTELDQTTASLASAKIVKGRASVDMESAIADLEDLARRAQKL